MALSIQKVGKQFSSVGVISPGGSRFSTLASDLSLRTLLCCAVVGEFAWIVLYVKFSG